MILNLIHRNSHLLGESWMFWVFLLTIFILAIVRRYYEKNFKDLFQSVVNIRLLREILREEIILTSRASQLLVILALNSIALFLFLCFSHWDKLFLGIPLNGLLNFVFIVCFCVTTYFVKITCIYLVRNVFENSYTLVEYEFNYSLLIKSLGISLLPISLLLAYYSESSRSIFMGLGGSLFGLSILWRWIRGVLNAFSHRISIVYIILYFCTLEILPIAVLVKWMF